jgi:DNA (cytosine-5)-methyltransferase 1
VGEKLRFLDLFAGIGGFRLALEQAGHKCVGFCEIDEFARQTYKANFNTEGEVDWEDITEVTDNEARELRGKVDLITAGFPCQTFSVAGERRGFEDTRGAMFFETARITKQIEPRFLLLENVKGLLSHDKGRTFAIILSTLDELGYDVEWQVLNSKDFGVPQNRERVFIVGHSRRFPRREVFPITRSSRQALVQIGNIYPSGGQNGNVYDPKGLSPTLRSGQGVKGRGIGSSNSPKIAVPVLTPNKPEKRQKGFDNKGEKTGVLEGDVRVRRLTPLECFRLQGFPDEHFHNAKAAGVSDTQLYKQAGNAVTVNVVYEIARRL